MTDDVLIRPARPGDAASLSRLGALDAATSFGHRLAALARSPAPSQVLVAEADGALVAALDVRNGSLVSDPFQRAAAARQLLAVRYHQLRRAAADAARPSDRRLTRRLLPAG